MEAQTCALRSSRQTRKAQDHAQPQLPCSARDVYEDFSSAEPSPHSPNAAAVTTVVVAAETLHYVRSSHLAHSSKSCSSKSSTVGMAAVAIVVAAAG